MDDGDDGTQASEETDGSGTNDEDGTALGAKDVDNDAVEDSRDLGGVSRNCLFAWREPPLSLFERLEAWKLRDPKTPAFAITIATARRRRTSQSPPASEPLFAPWVSNCFQRIFAIGWLSSLFMSPRMDPNVNNIELPCSGDSEDGNTALAREIDEWETCAAPGEKDSRRCIADQRHAQPEGQQVR